MAQEPENLILQLLREIRSKLDEHDHRFDENDRQFAALNKKIEDWQETTATGLGLASHANIRNTALEERIAELTKRVELLENSMRPTGH